MKYLTILLLAGMSVSATAATMRLTYMSMRDPVPVYISSSSYDGIGRTVDQFYRDENVNVKLSMFIAAGANTAYNIHVDTGHNAPKYYEEPSLTVGITRRHWLYRQSVRSAYLQYRIAGTVGGDIAHSPCADIYGRTYYCATLRAWADFEDKTREQSGFKQLGLKFGLKF